MIRLQASRAEMPNHEIRLMNAHISSNPENRRWMTVCLSIHATPMSAMSMQQKRRVDIDRYERENTGAEKPRAAWRGAPCKSAGAYKTAQKKRVPRKAGRRGYVPHAEIAHVIALRPYMASRIRGVGGARKRMSPRIRQKRKEENKTRDMFDPTSSSTDATPFPQSRRR